MGNVRALPLPRLQMPQVSLDSFKRFARIISVVVTTAFVLKLPMFPQMVISLGDSAFTVIFLFYTTLIWRYYEALPMLKKTVLTSLIQDLVLVVGSVRVLQIAKNWFLSAHAVVQFLQLTDYTNVACSVLGYSVYPIFNLHIVFAIFTFQALAKINPPTYLSLNHVKARKMALCICIITFSAELMILSLTYGTLCFKLDLAYIQSFTGLKFQPSITVPTFGPLVLAISCSPRLVYYCWVNRSKQKKGTGSHSQQTRMFYSNVTPLAEVNNEHNTSSVTNDVVISITDIEILNVHDEEIGEETSLRDNSTASRNDKVVEGEVFRNNAVVEEEVSRSDDAIEGAASVNNDIVEEEATRKGEVIEGEASRKDNVVEGACRNEKMAVEGVVTRNIYIVVEGSVSENNNLEVDATESRNFHSVMHSRASRNDFSVTYSRASRNVDIGIEEAICINNGLGAESTENIEEHIRGCTNRSTRKVFSVIEFCQRQLKRNVIEPEGTVSPFGKTQSPYIIDLNFTWILILITLLCFILTTLFISTQHWWIIIHYKDLGTLVCLMYWVHSSREISEYATRKLAQFIDSYVTID